jgi:putative cell wall-binding protein
MVIDSESSITENGDTLRTGPWTYPYNAANGYRFRKFNNYESWERESQPQSNINSQVIRFADVKLMLAEAIIRGNGNLEDARQQINDVRNRVGAFEYSSAYFSNNALDILKRERRLELCGEQKRYFDLIRWGEAKEVINAEKQAEIGREPFQDKHYRFPIPQLERDINPEVAAEVSDGWN